MNRIRVFSILSLAIVLASCARDIEGENVPVAEMSGISVYAEAPQPESEAENQAKVTLNDGGDFYYTTWSATDMAMLVENSAAGMVCSLSTSVVLSDNSKRARFEFEPLTPVVAESFDYAVFHPVFSEGSGDNKKNFPYADGLKLNLKLLPGQTPEATTPDQKTCMIMGLSNGHKVRPDRLDVQFSHIVSYGRMTLQGLAENEKITSVNLSFQGCNVAGEMSWTAGGGVKYDEGNRNWIYLTCNKVVVNKGKADIWFACKPCTLAAGKTLTITTKTSLNPDGYEIRLTAKKNVMFEAGKVTEFPAYVSKNTKLIPDPGYTVTGRTWYVSVNGNDNNSGAAPSDAFKTFEKVLTKIGPGDQVRIMPGTYEATPWNGNIDLKKEHSGTPGNYISFVAHDPNNRPVLHAGGKGVWQSVNINASYIVIDGLEVCGDNQKINLQDAYNFAKQYYETGTCDWAEAAVFNTNGISAGATGSKTGVPHHVIIRNCIIHDMPGGGAGAIQGDYITIEYNTIYNCAWYTMYGCSGISYLTPINTDDYTGYKMIVRGNKVFNCRTDVPWVRKGVSFNYSDGNGIIIDVNATPDGAGPGKDQGEYKGRTLVINNISVNNGGSGIHTYKANHVDIVGNTAYHNGHKYDGNYGEIWAHQGGDVHIYNNIMYSRPGGKCNLGNGAEYTNNVYFNGQVKIQGKGDLVADPMFVNLSKEISEADFHLTAGSPAIGYGALDMNYLPEFDHDFYIRKGGFDCGAYQYIAK